MTEPTEELEATYLRDHRYDLRDHRYAVRPKGRLGTHGFINGKGWEVIYVTARTPQEAVKKAIKRSQRGKTP